MDKAGKALTEDNSGANLWAFLTGLPTSSALGYAHVGTVCASKKIRRTSINSLFNGVVGTAQVVAHETGHNLGMNHDNSRTFKGKSCKKTGAMSGVPGVWSKCSQNDIHALYDFYISMNQKWCLKGKFE